MSVQHPWVPNEMQRRCLTHLDQPRAWEMLGRPQPEQDDLLPFGFFTRIFWMNFPVFVLLLTGIFVLLELVNASFADLKQDAPFGLPMAAIIAAALALYVMNLYRTSWNGRARSLTR